MTGTGVSHRDGEERAAVHGAAPVRELLRLRPGARVVPDATGATRVYAGQRGTFLGTLTPDRSAALELLGAGAADEESLLTGVRGRVAEPDLPRVRELVRRLRAHGWLSVTLTAGRTRLLTFRPLGPAAPPPAGSAAAPDPAALRLSRFAVLRADTSGMVLESPLAQVAAEIHDAGLVGLLASLAAPAARDAAAAGPHPVEWPEAVPAVLGALARQGFLVPRDGGHEREFRYAQWAPHELLFHSRSRDGRHDAPFGGTRWAEGVTDPLPAVRPPFGGPVVPLPRADLEDLRANDMTLTEVLEDRRSLRRHDDTAPLTLARLGEFLYRCARNRGVRGDGKQEVGDRPYPSGGGSHELEIYPLVERVDGVPPGLYHYDPERHVLELVTRPGPAVRRLSEMSRLTARMSSPPQVALLVTARFGRVMWKYSAMGYAMTLKHVGVLYQVMYSVATAMGLAGCALGSGDGDAFAAATGLPWETESTVGEFLLGSRAAQDA
ncbi:SagB family peptide dehydrogenase [Streptomyces sp. NPDC090080]|uniref:SagB/ThcOx family dehydrogenase n=1 Tax=Streptomyces sp. NPDC090080 TaxID=3365939 RepID=UPI003807BCF7